MKMIVGLGNPGKEYEKTRHNAGFLMLDYFLKEQGIGDNFKFEKKFNAEIAEWNMDRSPMSDCVRLEDDKKEGISASRPGSKSNETEKVLLVKPMTFMNLSGKAVKGLMDYYKIELADILIVLDDMDIPLGEIRLRKTGRSGGHNGLQSIIDEFGTDEISRVKLGIGRPEHSATSHVLEKFSKEEAELFDKVLNKGNEIVCEFIRFTDLDNSSKSVV